MSSDEHDLQMHRMQEQIIAVNDNENQPEPYNPDQQLRKCIAYFKENYQNHKPLILVVNVYEINSRFRCLQCLNCGVFHTAIQFYNNFEFGYGGCAEMEGTGVFVAESQNTQSQMRLVKQIVIKEVNYTVYEFLDRVLEISKSWAANEYNVLQRNCNHFTQSLCNDVSTKKNQVKNINNAANYYLGYLKCTSKCHNRCNKSKLTKNLKQDIDDKTCQKKNTKEQQKSHIAAANNENMTKIV